MPGMDRHRSPPCPARQATRQAPSQPLPRLTCDQQVLAVGVPGNAVHVLRTVRPGHVQDRGAAMPRVPQQQREVVA